MHDLLRVLVTNGLDDASDVQEPSAMEPVFESEWLERDQEPTGR